MAFGKAAQTKTQNATFEKPTENIFFDTKNGIRIFQIPIGSDEIKVKRHWLAQESDGTWIPKFGFLKGDKRRSVPIVVAVWDVNDQRWIGHESNWRKNPIDQWVMCLEEEDRKMKYAQERFYINVVDLSLVKIDSEGVIYYPDEKMQYTGISADIPKQPLGRMRILEGSSSDPDGKSLYANLYRTTMGALDEDGEPLEPTSYQMKLVTTGSEKNTNRSFQMHTIKPIDSQYADLPMYDLVSWLKPWPNDAIEALMNGGDYTDIVKQYNIQLYPSLKENDGSF